MRSARKLLDPHNTQLTVANPLKASYPPVRPNPPPEPEKRYKPHRWFVDFERGEGGRSFDSFGRELPWMKVGQFYKDLKVLGFLRWWGKILHLAEAWFEKGDKILVGEDPSGNKYWQSTRTIAPRDRWVEFSRGRYWTDVSEIPRGWHIWMSRIADVPLHELPLLYPNHRHQYVRFENWFDEPHKTNSVGFQMNKWAPGNPHPNNPYWENFAWRNRVVHREIPSEGGNPLMPHDVQPNTRNKDVDIHPMNDNKRIVRNWHAYPHA
eukprot:TRINITY_DN10981_c0_g1_i1.p2 TRINITY_DN10981_c0_g1~~TRINITY_DN10981_c0_g1_i1.p2  ORF type:complete len:265 (-),score=46.46 TRINITY_DN10981_c0_g1_i1:43-837(-)